jgi:hypothetical protein
MTTPKVTDSVRNKVIRQVFVTFPGVGPKGTDYEFEMTSYKGGCVELYRKQADGLMRYEGTIRAYAGSEELRAEFRKAWYSAQPSKAARESFEASCLFR